MKFQDYVKIKNQLVEQLAADMGYSNSFLNESNTYQGAPALNESLEDMMKRIMSGINYLQCMELMDKYEKAALENDPNVIAEKFAAKTAQILAKIEQLEKAKATTKERSKKTMLIDKIEKLEEMKDKIVAGREVYTEKMTQAKGDIDSKFTELTADMVDPFKTLVSNNKSKIDNEVKLKGLEVKEKTTMRDEKDPVRKEKFQKEKATVNASYEKALKRLEDGEDAAETDLEELEGIDAYKDQIKDFMSKATEVKQKRAELQNIWNDADALILDNVNPKYAERFQISEDIDLLFEEETGKSGKTPLEVLQHINSIKVKDKNGEVDEANVEKKKALYDKLKTATAEYVTAVEARVNAKKALWDAIPNDAPVTKELLIVAGADSEKTKADADGKFNKGSATLSKTWDAAFNKPEEYGPIKDVKAVEITDPSDPSKKIKKSLEEVIQLKTDDLPEVSTKEPEPEQEETDEQKIQKLKDKGYDKEDVSDPEATIPVDIKDDSGAPVSTEEKPKWKKGGEVAGKKYYKQLQYDDKGNATNNEQESYSGNIKSKVFERRSRIVPTFESYVNFIKK